MFSDSYQTNRRINSIIFTLENINQLTRIGDNSEGQGGIPTNIHYWTQVILLFWFSIWDAWSFLCLLNCWMLSWSWIRIVDYCVNWNSAWLGRIGFTSKNHMCFSFLLFSMKMWYSVVFFIVTILFLISSLFCWDFGGLKICHQWNGQFCYGCNVESLLGLLFAFGFLCDLALIVVIFCLLCMRQRREGLKGDDAMVMEGNNVVQE